MKRVFYMVEIWESIEIIQYYKKIKSIQTGGTVNLALCYKNQNKMYKTGFNKDY